MVINIRPFIQRKKGVPYTRYVVMDYRSGRRKQKSFSNIAKARKHAKEIADELMQGHPVDMVSLDGLKLEIKKSLEQLNPTGLSLFPASSLLAQAVRILGTPDDLLAACQHWKQNKPDKPIIPKSIAGAVAEFLEREARRVSDKRYVNEKLSLSHFIGYFPNAQLTDVDAAMLTDFVGQHNKVWKPKTSNDILAVISLLYREAQLRRWVPQDFNPTKKVVRRKEIRSPIHIFEPWEARQLLSRLAEESSDLVPAIALWLFSGLRRAEIARLMWRDIQRAFKTGYVFIEAAKTKTGKERTLKLTENLRDWLLKYQKHDGTVMPGWWLMKTKSANDRLAELPRFLTRKTGIVWRTNAPRHSFATYHFKLHDNHGEATKEMGTSLKQFEKHYWCKADTVTREAAEEWFSIRPQQLTNVIPLSPSTASELDQGSAEPAHADESQKKVECK